MFVLNEAEFNIVKRAAKDCVNEIADRIEQKDEKYDRIAAGVICKHYQPISTLLTKTQFIWLAGYLRGRWGKNFDRE